MMIEPDVTSLINRAGSRYALVVAASKRARQLVDGDEPRVQLDFVAADRPVTAAVEEIDQEMVICHTETQN
nr:DNA-directed RNA polymerase subunit omega [bacterium]